MLPIPVVIQNYRTQTDTSPNQNSIYSTCFFFIIISTQFLVAEESKWVYHRRFFLVDRVSGISNNGTTFFARFSPR